MKKRQSWLYENFHKTTKFQIRIIKEKNFTHRNLIGVLKKYVDGERKILDIGCGAGTVDFYLANQCHNVLGIDISTKAVGMCKKSAQVLDLEKNLKFERLNFPKEKPLGKFDIVICSEALEHLENDKEAIKVIFLLLRSGGIAIFSTPSKNAPLYRLGLAKKFDKRVGHLRRYSPKELKNLIERSGFSILGVIKTEGILRNFLFVNSVAGKIIKFLRGSAADLFTFLDNITLKLFGESQIFVIAQKK